VPSRFEPLPRVPDHPAIERELLDTWERERTFEQLREKNRGGATWSFVDGPVTANKSLAVHTAWGRTLKDVFQRYKALRGYDQRYQNGFDCQGLWIEVGVERQLGLNSKREIEEYGLEEFAARCRDVVVKSADELIRGSKRLGQWMDWGNDYYTFSDTNIEYIWCFLKTVHERGWLYVGHRSTEWCPRCGTSISAHELTGSYVDRADPSLQVRLPLLDRPGESLVVWTTTPWTLPANVAAAVNPEFTYGRREAGEWVAAAGDDDEGFAETKRGSELVGWRYEGPFDELPAQRPVEHRVIPWKDVSLEEGTGIVHIAPGAGQEDFELGRELDLPVLTPVDEGGHYYDDYGWLHGLSTTDANEQIIGWLEERGRVVESGLYEHRYPECWRCHTPLIFRVADDWFISVAEIRQPMRDANAEVEWTPDYFGKRMDDWLVNMGDWNISRRRYYGLPLPFYPCSCGHLNVVGSREELEGRAVAGLDQLQELHRPWIDRVPIRCEECGETVERIAEVGDVWLDAGIVPLSTLGWQNPEWVEGGYGRGAAKGLTGADLPDNSYWETWFPADLVSEMREQIRLWFYSQLFMSVALVGKSPFKSVLGYEKMLAEDGREMHGSWGNMIDAEEAFERMGADVMRWQFCTQPPDRNLLFGYSAAGEIKKKLLTLWNSATFLVNYANIEGFEPVLADLDGGPDCEPSGLDRWLVERTYELVDQCSRALDAQLSHQVMRAFEAYLDDLSNWYIRRSRRRFYSWDESAFRTLWTALAQTLRVIAPVMPFLADHLWRRLVADVCDAAPASVHLAGWPEPRALDRELLDAVAEVRRVVELGRSARMQAKLPMRQPLRRLVVQGAPRVSSYLDEISDELRIKEVELGEIEAIELRVKPNLPVLGPRLGRELGAVRSALAEGRFEQLEGGGFRVDGHELSAGDVLVERGAREGWSLASSDGLTVAIDTTLDDELLRERRVLDLVHEVNGLRREAGLEITDRIRLTLPPEYEDLREYEQRVADETLAVDVAYGDVDAPQVAKA
jgi:isoleucyl-tRNA synthetase